VVFGCVEIADIRLVVEFVTVQDDGRYDRHGKYGRHSPSRERTVIPEVPGEIEDAELVGLCEIQEGAEGRVGVYRLPVDQAVVLGIVAQASTNLVLGHLGACGAAQESSEGVGNRNGRPIGGEN
jgi:hypothetical protein